MSKQKKISRDTISEDEAEKLVKLENKLTDFRIEANRKRKKEKKEPDISVSDKFDEWLDKPVYGEIKQILPEDESVSIEIEFDDTVFEKEFELPKDEHDLIHNDYPIIDLLKYKDIKDGRFTDLRGENIPVLDKAEEFNILIPLTHNKLSKSLFKAFNVSRKYKLIEKETRYQNRKFRVSERGYILSTFIGGPILMIFGYLSGILSNLLIGVPVLHGGLVFMSFLSLLSGTMLTFIGIFIAFFALLIATLTLIDLIIGKSNEKLNPFS